MGIRKDLENGIGREEYILVRSAVCVLAARAKASLPEVARWLIKKNIAAEAYGWSKNEHGQMKLFGQADPRMKEISHLINEEYALKALHALADSDGKNSFAVYWQIEALLEAISRCGETVDRSLFVNQAEQDHALRIERIAESQSNPDSGKDSIPALHSKIQDLEKTVAALKNTASQADGKKNTSPNGERSETTYLNIIGGLLGLMQGTSQGGQAQSIYRSQNAIIEALIAHHSGKQGIAERTLQEKFAAANRTISA